MSELGPDARSILDAARGGDEPTDGDRKRVHSSLARRIGVGAAILGTTTATSASAGGATIAAGVSSLTKVVVLVVGMVGVLGGGTYVVHRLVTPKPTPPTTTVTTTKAIAPAPIPTPDPTAVPLAPPAPVATLEPAPVPVPVPTPIAMPAPTPAPSAAKKSSFDDELAAMQQAQAALGAGDAQKALTLLDDQAKQFPNGALAQERAGMRVVALCDLGRPEARAQAEKFLAAHPQSPMALRIRSACKIGD